MIKNNIGFKPPWSSGFPPPRGGNTRKSLHF